MLRIEVLMFGFFLKFACGNVNVDIVLSCSLVEEGAGMAAMGGGAFKRTPATLILRDVSVPPDDSLETLTPFMPPSVADPDAVLVEAKVLSPEIPDAEVLLHADCNQQEVLCELSRYTPQGAQQSSDSAYLMVSLDVEGVDFSTMIILQTVKTEDTGLVQTNLGLPLSQSGMLLTEVIFLVFAPVKAVTAPLRGNVLLNCGFKQLDEPFAPEVSVEWRLQHRGKGHRVLEMKTRLDDAEGSAMAGEGRAGASVNATRVVAEGDASVTLSRLKVRDDGTYICTVSVGPFHAQQIVQLHVVQPPGLSLSEEKLIHKDKSPQILSCHCTKYFPLDAQMEWTFLSPSDSEPTVFPDQGSLSSHRQHGDGTYSVSSHLTVPPSLPPGTKITCTASHPALESAMSVSLLLETPRQDSYWWVLGFLIITALFFYQVMK